MPFDPFPKNKGSASDSQWAGHRSQIESWEAILSEGLDAISRRRFLSLLSASAALALGTSCSRIDRGTIVPYTRTPGEIIPGVAAYYASTFQEGIGAHGVLVKTREGRPIHIEGNPEHPLSRGKTSLRAMGDLLGLYDPDRLRAPVYKGKPSSWAEAENALVQSLSEARLKNRSVLLLTGAVISPTQRKLIADLKNAVPGLYHAAWEPLAPQSEMSAMKALYGEALIPAFHFDRADVVLSLQSDFLGTDSNAPAHIQDFAARRAISQPTDPMNRLWVLEGNMTLTGFNADQRLPVRPSQIAGLAFALARHLNEAHSLPLPSGLSPGLFKPFSIESAAQRAGIDAPILKLLAADLAGAGKSALVLAGPTLPSEIHMACHLLNLMLGSVGNTLDIKSAPTCPDLFTLSELQALFREAAEGKYSAGIFWGVNPAYAMHNSIWKSAIGKIQETYRIGLYEDETALDCYWRLPEHHWLEAWGDFEAAADFISLRQPAIGAIHDTRQAEDLLLSCMRKMDIPKPSNYLDYLKSRWSAEIFPKESPAPFENYWNAALHNGGVKRKPVSHVTRTMNVEGIGKILAESANFIPAGGRMELILSPGAGVYDGRYANNGWLNELPDPVTKATWGNQLLLSAADAERLGLKDEDAVRISGGTGYGDFPRLIPMAHGVQGIEIPVMVQPGQAAGVAEIVLGYGRQTGNVATGIGVNAYPMMPISASSSRLIVDVLINRSKNNERRAISKRQMQDRMNGNDQVRSWTLAEYSEKIRNKKVEEKSEPASLIPDQRFPEHKWSMGVDLSACVGCSACVIACQSENNIPVVGPERVREGRDMLWIRIDRYYAGDLRNPSVLFQPVLCQHCDNAPCEIVCPVNATTHSPDGLNQMAYNRCVGTRYCSNNCPFKVRRFNFFDYTSMKKAPENLIFNPEVTVRPRGVMEKCTFCIQRIEDARMKAKTEGRSIRDGEIKPACAVACPANAIIFGDLNDPQSRVRMLLKKNRNYKMLEELGIKPSVSYLADISNPAVGKNNI
jgi:Fe-S-cluster-containing dehydrogenase component/anaerobic selenocysteine-containing dehydrogenase